METITRTLSRRTFAGTVTGKAAQRDEHGLVTGPVVVTVEVTQSRRADGVECWPNYSVIVDGCRFGGGCADHLPADGIPASTWLTIGSELEAERTDLAAVDDVLAEMSTYAAGRLRDVVDVIRARTDDDSVNVGELIVTTSVLGTVWAGIATGDTTGADDELIAGADNVVVFDSLGEQIDRHEGAELSVSRRVVDAGELSYWAGRYADELELEADELERRRRILELRLETLGNNVHAARRAARRVEVSA